jgi:hypothetical protein
MVPNSYTAKLPSAIYVWIVPSEEVLDQPGSWRIRKWDTEPFPEANFSLRQDELHGPSSEAALKSEAAFLRHLRDLLSPPEGKDPYYPQTPCERNALNSIGARLMLISAACNATVETP